MPHLGIQLRPCCSKANGLSRLLLNVVPALSGIHDEGTMGKVVSPLIIYEHWVVVVVMKDI
jgi:hypothetical protein